MGMFDEILVPCPTCGERVEFQSKSGPCTLSRYLLEECPADVLMDVNRHGGYRCEECDTSFAVFVVDGKAVPGKVHNHADVPDAVVLPSKHTRLLDAVIALRDDWSRPNLRDEEWSGIVFVADLNALIAEFDS